MNLSSSAATARSEPRLLFQLATVLLVMLAGATVYELIDQWFITGPLSWQSHLISILFSSGAATTAAWFVLRRRQELTQRMSAEITQRERVEAELRRAQTELETRVHERTEELVAANHALRSEIAERKNAEGALQASERKFRSLVAQSFEGIALTDEQGSIVEWNESEAEITGLLHSEVLGEPIWDVIFYLTPLKQRTLTLYRELKDGIQQALRTGQAPWLNHLVERKVERRDGACRVIDTFTYLIRTDKGFMIGRVSRDITERKRSEEERVRAYRQAGVEERQRLARELHDSVSQALYGIELGAMTARELLDTSPDGAGLKATLAEPLDYCLALAGAGLAEMRSLIFELRPESLETEGLVAGLNKQVASLRSRHHLSVQVEVCPEPDIALEVKETLYRIAQEALHNTVKHARAREARLELSCQDGHITLTVSDDGQGFDAAGSYPGHLGLRSMRERAERLGGQFELTSGPEAGTHIRVCIPLPSHAVVPI